LFFDAFLNCESEVLLSCSALLDTRLSLSLAVAFLDSQVVVVLEDSVGGLDSVFSVALLDIGDSASNSFIINLTSALSD